MTEQYIHSRNLEKIMDIDISSPQSEFLNNAIKVELKDLSLAPLKKNKNSLAAAIWKIIDDKGSDTPGIRTEINRIILNFLNLLRNKLHDIHINGSKGLIGTCLLLSTFSSCRNSDYILGNYDEILINTEINPVFEKSPPIAKRLTIEILKKPLKSGENIRIVAEFDNDKLSDRFLAVNTGDQKMVLRDDGKGADLKANDNQYAIFINEDIEGLKDQLLKKQLGMLSQNENFTFKNRRQILLDRKKLMAFDIEDLRVGHLIDIPIELIIGAINFNNQQKTLMITDPRVVDDPTRTYDMNTCIGNPNGVWTFGTLMRQMASPNPGAIASDAQVSAFVLNWLSTWQVDQTVNGDVAFRKEDLHSVITEPWLLRSSLSGAPAGQLDMEQAPFELKAIVNRLDLRGNSGYGMSNAGEGRFIFRLLFPFSCDFDEDPGTLLSGPFLVILEYGINKKKCASIKSFAQQWADLSNYSMGTAAYNNALEAITLQFTQSGTNPDRPNQSSINQVRTNEDAIGLGWQLREFKLNTTGQLQMSTVQMEPAQKHNGINTPISGVDVNRLAQYINSMTSNILNNNYVVPEQIPLTPGTTSPTTGFLGATGFSGVSPEPFRYWDGTTTAGTGYINSDGARHVFSLNTCSGCHSKETDTQFLHVGGPGFSGLSGFLTGITVTDAANRPSGSPTVRTFNDLLRRQIDLSNFIESTCGPIKTLDLFQRVTFEPINMVH